MLLDDELRGTTECRLVTVGRTSGRDREVRIWFASVGDRVYLLSQDQERAHWVKNAAAEPQVRIRFWKGASVRAFQGVARVVGAMDVEDGIARDLWAEKYGTKYFVKFLHEALVVAVELEREVS
jgi:hypothetical protein